jgi:beta-lactamase regulating signal transducer with metallopeptidase domain
MTLSAVFESMVSLSVQVAVLMLVAGWLSHFVRSDRAGDRIWQVCHGLVLLLTIATFLIPHLRLVPHSIVIDQSNRHTVLKLTAEAGEVLLYLWLVGFTIGCAALMLSTAGIHRMLKVAEPMSSDELKSRCGLIVTRLPNGREIRWRRSALTDGPFCWQIHTPFIVLPEFVLEFEDDELAAVVHHEIAHLMIGHPLSLFLQRLVELLFWFHPIVWWGSWQAARWREFVCDRSSARSLDEAAACLHSLLKLAERGVTVTGGMPAGLNFGAHRSLTQERALRLSEFDRPESASLWQQMLWIWVVVATMVVTLVQLPLNPEATERSLWSPWPAWSTEALRAVGVHARDYEIDNHRLWEDHAHRFGNVIDHPMAGPNGERAQK